MATAMCVVSLGDCCSQFLDIQSPDESLQCPAS